jgi:hypothetical protein
MRSSRGLALSVAVLLLGAGVALAQAPADTKPATDSKPAASKPAAATPGGDKADKKAISKACSDQATAKGLHGKERKTFRAECKKNGGKPA